MGLYEDYAAEYLDTQKAANVEWTLKTIDHVLPMEPPLVAVEIRKYQPIDKSNYVFSYSFNKRGWYRITIKGAGGGGGGGGGYFGSSLLGSAGGQGGVITTDFLVLTKCTAEIVVGVGGTGGSLGVADWGSTGGNGGKGGVPGGANGANGAYIDANDHEGFASFGGGEGVILLLPLQMVYTYL